MTVQIHGGSVSFTRELAAGHAPILSRTGLVVGIALLSGCASYTPRPADPFDALEKLDRRSKDSHALKVQAQGSQEWLPLKPDIDFTDGLDLPEANALALAFSPEARSARRKQKVAGAQLLGAGLLKNPEIFLGPRISSSGNGLIFPVGLSWELPLWGQREAQRSLAHRKLTVSEARVAAAELSVLTEVRAAFIHIASIGKTVKTLEAQLVGSERVLQWAGALKQAGEIDGVTSYLAKLDRDEAKADLEGLRHELQSARRNLLKTIGLLPNAELSIQLEPDPAAMPELPALNREKMALHPRIASALNEYETAEASLKLEIASQYPAIRIGPEFESEKGEASIGLGAGAELPLFDRNRGGIAAAEQFREAARENIAAELLNLSHTEAQARAEYLANERILGGYRAGALADALEARKSLDLRLQAGQSNVLEVLAGLRSLAGARVRELELERASTTARFRAAVAGGAALKDPAQKDSTKEQE
ncbi:MAG: TolC family protein [Planctomycetota bacterium]|nr:TolC family protein [Planctomycetota bacterium]